MPLAGETELSALTKDPQVMIRVPIGAVSPLWGLFAGAAVSGAAWWWMTRWARPANLEAALGAEAAAAQPTLEAVMAAPEALEPMVEAIAETVEEAPPAPVAEAIIEDAPLAVGGEAAPVSPVLEALAPEALAPEVIETAPEPTVLEVEPAPQPAPKPKKAAPKAD